MNIEFRQTNMIFDFQYLGPDVDLFLLIWCHPKICFKNFEIDIYDFLTSNWPKTIPQLSLWLKIYNQSLGYHGPFHNGLFMKKLNLIFRRYRSYNLYAAV